MPEKCREEVDIAVRHGADVDSKNKSCQDAIPSSWASLAGSGEKLLPTYTSIRFYIHVSTDENSSHCTIPNGDPHW